ncbi:MAG TPA: glucoamylase family protein [Bryobacteraceae bacterium]|nr:glucoamylase family protein [Bryobacteraceae bacterium]
MSFGTEHANVVSSRREALRRIAILTGASATANRLFSLAETTEPQTGEPDLIAGQAALSPEDQAFLDELEHAAFLYFWEQADPNTGLVKDRCNVRSGNDTGTVASIAATGFGLTALCIGHSRGFVPLADVRGRVIAALRFLYEKMPAHRGFFYHWADVHSGERTWNSEISSIDTAILLCGVLTCRQHFRYREISRLATLIFNRVNWTWLSADTSLLPHGWTPELGFLQYRWDYYSELMMMYLLGLGSTTHPLPVQTWHAWKRLTFEYDGLRYIGSYAPLFVHQYSQAWFDFRGTRDRYANYFQNSTIATQVHRRFCLELSKRYPHFTEDLWGITASDSRNGYVVWGGPPEMGPIDGTVVPSAAGGSLAFLPRETLRVLKHIRSRYGERTWSRYGFVNAFNPMTEWYDTDVVGIDTGVTLLMAENLRTGFVWDAFSRNPEVVAALKRAEFTEG